MAGKRLTGSVDLPDRRRPEGAAQGLGFRSGQTYIRVHRGSTRIRRGFPRVEAIMRATALVSIILATMVLAATDAAAASFCAFYGGRKGGSENCGFSSMEQCLAQVRGVGGWCRPNPFPGTAFGTAGTWGSVPSRQYKGGY